MKLQMFSSSDYSARKECIYKVDQIDLTSFDEAFVMTYDYDMTLFTSKWNPSP